jgi:hypothetical protein
MVLEVVTPRPKATSYARAVRVQMQVQVQVQVRKHPAMAPWGVPTSDQAVIDAQR